MGYRALRLDNVRRVSHFGTELRRFVRDAEIAAAWTHGPNRARHTPDQRDWRGWGWNIHNRSNAAAFFAIHQGNTSRHFRHQSTSVPSICSTAYQPKSGSQQRSMEVGAASSTLDRWPTGALLNVSPLPISIATCRMARSASVGIYG